MLPEQGKLHDSRYQPSSRLCFPYVGPEKAVSFERFK